MRSITDFDQLRVRRDRVAVPTIWVALAASVLVHIAALWKWLPQVRTAASEHAERGDGRPALSVELAPRVAPKAAPARPMPPVPAPPEPRRAGKASAGRLARPAAPQKPTPRIAAVERPRTAIAVPQQTTPPPAPSASAENDLTAYVEARRRARRESAPAKPAEDNSPAPAASEDDNARANRIAAANLGVGRKPAFGPDTHGGGIFSIQRLGYDSAEFLFFGWNRDIRRNTTQLIEVRKGNNPDIRIAVVRRMIEIIRANESGDFVFESKRLGRNVTLSARPRDNAGLEDFMMREFFDPPRGAP